MRVVAIVVILLLSVMTFNAYACLVPFDVSSFSMADNCPTSQENQVPQYCDIFKTMGVESTVGASESQPSKSALACDFQGLDQIARQASQGYTACHRSDHKLQQFPSDLFLKLVTLRI